MKFSRIFYKCSHIVCTLFDGKEKPCCSVTKLCPTLCDPMDCSTPGSPVLHHLMELAQIHIRWVDDAIQPPNPLLPPYSPALKSLQHQGLFQRVGSSHQLAKVLGLQLQHQSFNQRWLNREALVAKWVGLTHLISLQSKGPSRVFSSTRIQKH